MAFKSVFAAQNTTQTQNGDCGLLILLMAHQPIKRWRKLDNHSALLLLLFDGLPASCHLQQMAAFPPSLQNIAL
jgi:hypothetical protein